MARTKFVATPHPSLPLKGAGEESEASASSLSYAAALERACMLRSNSTI